MIQSHPMKKFRPEALEALEDRAVPSAAGVPVHAEGSGGSTVQAELTQVDILINAAYSSFATSIYQAENALAESGGQGTAALTTSVGQAITTLQASLTSAVSGSISGNAVGLIQSQITGSSPGSLVSGMTGLLKAATAGTADGSIPATAYPPLVTAVQGEIGASYTSATVEAYLYATGKASGNTTNVNLPQYDSYINNSYGSFSTTIFKAESFLKVPAGATPQASTAGIVVSIVDSQVESLAQSLGSLVAGTSVASRAGAVQAQFIGTGPASLLNRMNSLLAASASPDGSIPASALPLLNAAVDAAINDSYTSTMVDAYLLATS